MSSGRNTLHARCLEIRKYSCVCLFAAESVTNISCVEDYDLQCRSEIGATYSILLFSDDKKCGRGVQGRLLDSRPGGKIRGEYAA
eukprot:164149-Amorphochlora_amoeboformis.AAC.2